MKTCAIIVAGGSGSRMQIEKNKVLLYIDGISVICKTLQAFSAMNQIVLVVRPCDQGEIVQEIQKNHISMHNIQFAYGGATRGESVQNGLQLVQDCDITLVHDAARPYVEKQDIERVIVQAKEHACAILASPVNDTLKKANDTLEIVQTVDRTNMYAAQTPQAFHTNLLKEIYAEAQKQNLQATDDASLAERLGYKVKIVPATSKNIKITRPEDIVQNYRVGHGFDVHKLVENRKCILFGVDVPYEKGLLGHSDADVGAHALMDAMLGAAALGDIGTHFPDNDMHYHNADSMLLLKKVQELLQSNGFQVLQLDCTIIAQVPKLAPYIQQMRQNIADVLQISLHCINVKATTTEKLGFTGRGEGIAAEAVCMIQGDALCNL